MKCKYCGNDLEKGEKKCKYCGSENKSIFSRKAIIGTVVVGALIVAAVLSAVIYAVTANDDIEASVIDEAAGEYMAVNVPVDHSFDITLDGGKSSNIAVKDIEGKDVKTEVERSGKRASINAPEGGYEEGEIYQIDLEGIGRFEDEEIKGAKKLLFVIERKNSENIEYRAKVKEVDPEEVEVSEEEIRLEGKYREGDIVVTDSNEDGYIEGYKLENVEVKGNRTTAGYTDPTADELYKEFDVFYYGNVDFSEADINEEALEGALEEAGILDAFIDDVYAAGKTNIEAKLKREGKNKFVLTAVISDEKDSDKKLTVTLGIENKLIIKINKKKVYIDDTFIITNGIDFSVSGEDKDIVEKRIKKAIEKYTASDGEGGEGSDYEVKLLSVPIPISKLVPTTLEVGLTAEVMFSAELNAGVDSEIKINQGIIYDIKKLKVDKKYGEATGDIEAYIMAQGDMFAFAGPYAKLEANALYVVKASADVKGGGYLDAAGCFTVKGIPKDIKSKGYYDAELGVMFAADADFEIPFVGTKSIPIAEKRKPLLKLSNSTTLKGTDLKERYYMGDEGIDIGTITATYHDLIEDEDISKEIESYSLYIDGKKVEVIDGIVKEKVKEGTHKFRIKWKDEGNSYTETKEVEVTSFDPWGYFVSKNILFSDLENLENNYGPLYGMNSDEYVRSLQDVTHIYDMDAMYYGNNDNMIFAFPSNNYNSCEGVLGTAQQLFGIRKTISIFDFIEITEPDYRFELIWTTDVLHNCWAGTKILNGKQYYVYVYIDGLKSIYFKPAYDPFDEVEDPKVTPYNAEEILDISGLDYKTISPDTKMVVIDSDGIVYSD